jgi:hypothetical protein
MKKGITFLKGDTVSGRGLKVSPFQKVKPFYAQPKGNSL